MPRLVQAGRTERPMRHGGGLTQFAPVTTPSVIESMGRCISAAFSEANGDALIGGDVGPAQRWKENLASFVGYGAGGGSNGTSLSLQHKKTVAFVESSSYGLWLTGANGGGGIFKRAVGASLWTLVTTAFYGEVQDGGGTDPRRAGHALTLIDGVNSWIACKRTSGSPAWGIAQSTNSGASFSAWVFDVARNYTGMVKSPQYNCIYASADDRATGGNDGVFILTGLGSGTGTVTRIDNIGVGAPTLADVRCVVVVREGTTDTLFVAVGNKAGSDPDRGVWRCRINADPAGGGFVASASCTWTHIQTPASSDRVQALVAHKPNGNSVGPIYLSVFYFKGSVVSSGTYTLSVGAGGTTETFRVVAQRSLDADAATPTFQTISTSANNSMVTYGTTHDHVLAYVGEKANEKARYGGSGFANHDAAISADGQTVILSCKATPWICKNPWAATPIFQPFSKGLGILEGGYSSVFRDDTSWWAVFDDDRGMYTYKTFGLIRPEWVIAENIDGIVSSNNAMNDGSLSLDKTEIYSGRDGDGRIYKTTNPWSYLTAVTHVQSPNTGPGVGIAGYQWVDSLAVTRTLFVTSTGIWRDSLKVFTFVSVAHRCDFAHEGANLWLHVPDLGIYRSNDDGATWAIWWDNAIASSTNAKFYGHMAKGVGSGVLYATFDTNGVWQCSGADTSTAGVGSGGSRPDGTQLMAGGALPLGTETVGPIAVDSQTGFIFACRPSVDGLATSKLYVLRTLTNWVDITDAEYTESAMLPQNLHAHDGWLWIQTAGNGTLRRMF